MPNKSTYIAHIDGLRALAILSVLFMHAGFSAFSGGFVGVDIFFVISGFLITRILVNEIQTKGSINFIYFYCRRVKRLLPALLFTLILSWIVALLSFSPDLFSSFGNSMASATLSFSNIFFMAKGGYFGLLAKSQPLLHTWSLGVEEQFYYVWPIFILLTSILLAKFKLKKNLLPIVIIFVLLISFFGNFLAYYNYFFYLAIYYVVVFRAFEFAIGALMIWVIDNYKIKNNLILEVLCLIGLSMIIIAIFSYKSGMVFPSYPALLPVIGAALIIYAGKSKYIGKILSNKLSVFIGLISYSLYLIHWPIIIFYHYIFGNVLGIYNNYLLIFASFVMAMLMFFFIEQKF